MNSAVREAMLGSYLCCLSLEEVRKEGSRNRSRGAGGEARDDWHRIYRDEARTAAGQLPGQL